MMGRLFQILAIIWLSLGGGTLLTWYSLRGNYAFDAVSIGQWKSFPVAGTASANPYAKARLARDARLSLGTAEGLVFYADLDSDGNAFSANCDYTLDGETPPARFWTMFPVDRLHTDQFEPRLGLPDSLFSGAIMNNGETRFAASISPRAKPGNWLSAPENGGFSLALLLYDTPLSSKTALVDTSLPTVRKLRCYD